MRASGVDEYRGLADSGSALALERLLASASVPSDRHQTWHAVASVLVVTAAGDVLLARNRTGGWGTVGGHVEGDDPDLRSAAARELAEEAGIVAGPHELVPLVFIADAGEFRPGHAHWDFCFALRLPARVDVLAADDVSEVGWFGLDSPPTLNDHMRTAVGALQRLAR